MDILEIEINKESDLENAANLLIKFANNENLWCFYGEMGAGKTTLIRYICKALKINVDEVSSPTYSIVNTYKTKEDKFVYHFDFYRINSIHEALDLGTEDYFYSENLCLVEWPQRVQPILKEKILEVNLLVINPYKRILTAKHQTL